jgi:hypothetical protein
MKKYAVLTETLCDGWVNCWTTGEADGSEAPSLFDTEAEAQAEIDDCIEGMREAHAEAGEDFDEEGERAQMVIVEAGQSYIDPCTATLMHLLTEVKA